MLEHMTPPQPRNRGRIAEILDVLEDKDREILLNALDDKAWSTHALAKALTDRGLKISDSVIQRYRQANDLAR
jgi:ribosome-binding protein aMBF1 (putative translation factor)